MTAEREGKAVRLRSKERPVNRLVTLTTDFGTQDGYAAAMKGAILSELPGATLVDLTHDVPPQDVRAGAFALAQAAPWFPTGTVHVAVVDPGVGSARRAIAIADAGSWLLGPDNGLLTLAAPAPPGRAFAIDPVGWRVPPVWRVQPTFHGRDLFARVAARLAGGASIEEFSSGEVTPTPLALPEPRTEDGVLVGEVIHVDRFGNLITCLRALPDRAEVELHRDGAIERAPLCETYADVGTGALLAYLGSAGFIEVGVRDGSAAKVLGLGRGAIVRVRAR